MAEALVVPREADVDRGGLRQPLTAVAATLRDVGQEQPAVVGSRLYGARGRRVGTVDAVFADYLLVRTRGLLPVDLYVPRPAVTASDGRLRVDCSPAEAYARWHRPLKRAPHEDR